MNPCLSVCLSKLLQTKLIADAGGIYGGSTEAIRNSLEYMWASVDTILSWEHRSQKEWQSWADEHGPGHPWLERRACQLCPQTRWSADPRSWKSSVTDLLESKVSQHLVDVGQLAYHSHGLCGVWHTAHFSTFPALLAHFTRARRRTNNCLVRLANWTISIFLKQNEIFHICLTMLANNELVTRWNWETYLSMSVFLGNLMNEWMDKCMSKSFHL